MGFDIFCILCGNPSSTSSLLSQKELDEAIIKYYETKQLKKKSSRDYGTINYWKPIVEEYENNPKLFIDNMNKIKSITNWMNDCTILTIDNKIMHGFRDIATGFFVKDKEHYNTSNIQIGYHNDYCEFIHTDCWKFIKKNYKIDLNFSYLPINYNLYRKKVISIDYGKIEKYWVQYFDFDKVIDDNIDLLYSPLVSKNTKHLKKIFNQLKIRTEKTIKSPASSATFYKSKTYKIGNNKNIWIVKSGKWKELNENTIEKKLKINKENELLTDLKYIGESSNIPFFIKTLNEKRNYVELIVITINSYLNNKIYI